MNGTFKEICKDLDFLMEENRRKTFKKWVFSKRDICNADRMAEAGFIFTGSKAEPDSVKCFLCHKSLDGWDATDDPWQEHLKHSTNCAFAKLSKAQDNMTLKQFIDIKNAFIETAIKSYFDKKAEEIEQVYEEYEEKFAARLTRNK